MADVNALFASRKSKKKGKKKKTTNANKIMVEQETNPDDDFVDENQGVLDLGMDGLDGGNWVDSDDDTGPSNQSTSFLMKGTKKGIANLDINEYNRMIKGEPAEEESANEFKWSSKEKGEAEGEGEGEGEAEGGEADENESEKTPEEESERRVYRPREMMAARAQADGTAALKQLDNEEVFPTLGGASTTTTTQKKSAWGAPVPKAKKPKAKYLGDDFIAAETFENEKPGYRFGAGENGTGYYWEGPAKAKEKAIKKEKEKSSIPVLDTKGETTTQTTAALEPEAPKPKIPAAPIVFESAEDKFSELAGLKKKKKKKKKKEATADE